MHWPKSKRKEPEVEYKRPKTMVMYLFRQNVEVKLPKPDLKYGHKPLGTS